MLEQFDAPLARMLAVGHYLLYLLLRFSPHKACYVFLSYSSFSLVMLFSIPWLTLPNSFFLTMSSSHSRRSLSIVMERVTFMFSTRFEPNIGLAVGEQHLLTAYHVLWCRGLRGCRNNERKRKQFTLNPNYTNGLRNR